MALKNISQSYMVCKSALMIVRIFFFFICPVSQVVAKNMGLYNKILISNINN